MILAVEVLAAWVVDRNGDHSLRLLCRSGKVVHEFDSELSSTVPVAAVVPAAGQDVLVVAIRG